MIAADQPIVFPDTIVVRVSSVQDGTMLDHSYKISEQDSIDNQTKFCNQNGIAYKNTVHQAIRYGCSEKYQTIRHVGPIDNKAHRVSAHADALITQQPEVGLFLPVADCVATVIADISVSQLALLHLGRHSTLTPLLQNVIEQFISNGSSVENLRVWMSPSAKKEHYVMDYFNHALQPRWRPYCEQTKDGFHLDIPGFNTQVCLDSGILAKDIEVSDVDTMTSGDYYSYAA